MKQNLLMVNEVNRETKAGTMVVVGRGNMDVEGDFRDRVLDRVGVAAGCFGKDRGYVCTTKRQLLAGGQPHVLDGSLCFARKGPLVLFQLPCDLQPLPGKTPDNPKPRPRAGMRPSTKRNGLLLYLWDSSGIIGTFQLNLKSTRHASLFHSSIKTLPQLFPRDAR